MFLSDRCWHSRALEVLTPLRRLNTHQHPLPARTFDSWPGIGRVAVEMHRQGFDLQLTQYDDRGWRATFYTTGMEHSPTSATGTGWEPTPWHATQRAGWGALGKGSAERTGSRLFGLR